MTANTPARPRPDPKQSRAKKPRARGSNVPQVIAEHGLRGRYARGEVAVEHSAADIENPNRTISRARVVWAYERLLARGVITREQREAADKYLVLHELQHGASSGELDGVPKAGWERDGGMDAKVHAARQIREADAALGPSATRIVRMLCVDNRTAAEIGERIGVSEKDTRARIVAGLERLVEHWGMDRPGRDGRIRTAAFASRSEDAAGDAAVSRDRA